MIRWEGGRFVNLHVKTINTVLVIARLVLNSNQDDWELPRNNKISLVQ